MLTLTGMTLTARADEAEVRPGTDDGVDDVDAALLEYLGSWESSDEAWLWLDGDSSFDDGLDDSSGDSEAAEDDGTTADGRRHRHPEPDAVEGQER